MMAGLKRVLVLTAMLSLAGCAAPAVSLLSPAISGVPAVADFVGSGASESYWVARYEDVVVAARKAGAIFGLTVAQDDETPERTILRLTDRTEAGIRLRIEPRTDSLTFIKFGGSAGMTRLMSRQIAHELAAADAFLVNWGEENGAFAR
ncbi:MAG: hypothetical protein O3B37_15045 [Proteobacteria bacterium]|nr:hypothetical protein [Pseudomonadota bacterium]